jgi:hypothetical protein
MALAIVFGMQIIRRGMNGRRDLHFLPLSSPFLASGRIALPPPGLWEKVDQGRRERKFDYAQEA